MRSYGIIGLGKMGGNLARNVSRFENIHVTNRSYEKVVKIVGTNGDMRGHRTVEDMVREMEGPRTVMTVLPSGKSTDDVTTKLCSLLSEGDAVIDLANDHYANSERRRAMFERRNIHYLDCGISGGSRGALEGPSLMIGGDAEAYEKHKGFLDAFSHNVHISERAGDGHFTKMVHNGVEYVMLQALADVYTYANKDAKEFDAALCSLKGTRVDGFLVDCAIHVSRHDDLDAASQVCEMNDTGAWCSQYAIERRVPLSLVTQSVMHRIESMCDRRAVEPSIPDANIVSPSLAGDALQFMYAMALIEGHELLAARGISIDRARTAWSQKTIVECPMILCDYEELVDVVRDKYVPSKIVFESCAKNDCSVPILSAAIQKYAFMKDNYRSTRLTMSQRHFFGGHRK